MINRDDIEAGDKVYTRDGGCLVAYEMNGGTRLAGQQPTSWSLDGFYIDRGETHPLDIIRIEKAPKPVVAERYLGLLMMANRGL